MDETLFFYSLSARFKPWYHSWPYVPESTTINPCLKIVIFYRTSPELLTFLVASNLKGRCSFPDHISKICFRYDNVCANIRDHNNCRRCLRKVPTVFFPKRIRNKVSKASNSPQLEYKQPVGWPYYFFTRWLTSFHIIHEQFLQMLTGNRRELSRATWRSYVTVIPVCKWGLILTSFSLIFVSSITTQQFNKHTTDQ